MRMRNKLKSNQGAALVFALIVMAIFTFISLALLYGSGQINAMVTLDRRRELCYEQALSLSDVIEEQLTSKTPGGAGAIYEAAKAYMPQINPSEEATDLVKEPYEYEATPTVAGYEKVKIRLQNGVQVLKESKDWQEDYLTNQYLDVTVTVYDERGAMGAVTRRYTYCQMYNLVDMEYTIQMSDGTHYIGGASDVYHNVPPTTEGAYFNYSVEIPSTDAEGNPTVEIVPRTLRWGGSDVTLKQADEWQGMVQTAADGSTLRVTRKRTPGGGEDWTDLSTYYFKTQQNR